MRGLATLALGALACLTAASLALAEESVPHGRLPEGLRPLHYELELTVVPSAPRFQGRARIQLMLDGPQSLLWLHGRGLTASAARLITAEGETVPATYREIEDSGIARIEAARPVGPGEATLEIVYEAPFKDTSEGLFAVAYGGEHYAFTQMEPIRARRVFPGFDEPRFKVPFDIALTVPVTATAVSNAPEASVEPAEPGLKRIRFQTTRPLPTYLIALAVGPLDIVDWQPVPPTPERDRPIPLRGVAPKGKAAEMAYGLSITAPLISLYEDYFGLPYPYAKLDLVAVPQLGPSGMENAGAIFYRDNRILLGSDPSVRQQRDFAGLHAHELAHNWFGNLVTPAWWNDLWLNEAFATWITDRVLSAWHPEDFDLRGPLRGSNWAMWRDRLPSARAVRQPIESNHGITNAFDSITYSKGGGILAMLESYLGPETFRDGVRRYMGRFPYGVATADDFLAALAEAAGDRSLTAAASTFLDQPGIPLLGIDWQCDKEGGAEIRLQQSRYLPPGVPPQAPQLWQLPLCLAYAVDGQSRSRCLVMREEALTLPLPGGGCPAWVLPQDGGGYYLWSLPATGWDALIDAFPTLEPAEQLALVYSASAAYKAAEMRLAGFLRLVRLAAASDSWDVVRAPMQTLREIKLFVAPWALMPDVMALYRQIYRPALDRFAVSDETLQRAPGTSEEALLLDDMVWFLALDADDPEMLDRLSRLGQAYLGYGSDGRLHPEALNADLVEAGLAAATIRLGLPFLEALIRRLKTSDDAILRSNIVDAIAMQTDPALVARVQELILDPALPKKEASRLLSRQSRKVLNRDAVWRFFTGRRDAVLARLPDSALDDLPWLASAFCSRQAAETVEAFFAPLIDAWTGAPRELAQSLEMIAMCAALEEAQGADAAAYFEANR